MHGDHLIELFFGHLAHRRVAGDSGVVDHDVERAEPVDSRVDQCIDVTPGCHVAAHCDGDVVAAELLGRGLRCLEIHVTEYYPGTFVNEPLRDGETQPLGATGEDCGLTGQQRHT